MKTAERPTRFLTGDAKTLSRILQSHRFKVVRAEIVIAQPGLSEESCTIDQKRVLAAADSYLMETISIGLTIVCSA